MRFRFLSTLLLSLALLFHAQAAVAGTGQQLIPFKGNDLKTGEPVDLARYIGEEPVLLVFWASWCPTCKHEVPKLNDLQARYHNNGLRIIGINVGMNDSRARAKKWIDKQKVTYPNIFDTKNTISRKYQVRGVPTVVIADKNGTIRFKNFGVPGIDDNAISQLNTP